MIYYCFVPVAEFNKICEKRARGKCPSSPLVGRKNALFITKEFRLVEFDEEKGDVFGAYDWHTQAEILALKEKGSFFYL